MFIFSFCILNIRFLDVKMFGTEHRCHLYRTDVAMGENCRLTVNKTCQTVHQSYNKTVSRTLISNWHDEESIPPILLIFSLTSFELRIIYRLQYSYSYCHKIRTVYFLKFIHCATDGPIIPSSIRTTPIILLISSFTPNKLLEAL